MKKLLVFVAILAWPSLSWAMCAATAKNLLRVRVQACQSIKINASYSRPQAHAAHKQGSSVTGVLVTGWVLDSELVWNGNEETADYLVDIDKVPVNEAATFFIKGQANRLCPMMIGKEKTFISDRPCCDVIPAKGMCLVPSPIVIVKEENVPQRWQKREAN
ncbi:MAG: hypothetical protein ACR2QU_01065 [Gammaproteobacteria bacterium]